MAIALDHEIETPDGNTVAYGLAQQHESGSTPLNVKVSWEQSASSSVTYWCNWVDIQQFMLTMVGDVEIGDDDEIYHRFLPHKLPSPSFYNLWCTGVDIAGIPGTDSTTTPGTPIIMPTYDDLKKLQYRYAKVTANYEPAVYPIKSNEDTTNEWERFTSITKTPRLEFLTVNVGSFYWIDQVEKVRGSALPHPLPIREQSVDWIVTWHRVPEAFFNPSDYIGYTNDADGFLAGHPQVRSDGFPKDTMLLLGINEIILPTCFREEPYYTYQYLFQERTNTHNKVRRYRNKDAAGNLLNPPTYEYNGFSLDGLTPTTNATRVFKQTGMSALFRPNG